MASISTSVPGVESNWTSRYCIEFFHTLLLRGIDIVLNVELAGFATISRSLPFTRKCRLTAAAERKVKQLEVGDKTADRYRLVSAQLKEHLGPLAAQDIVHLSRRIMGEVLHQMPPQPPAEETQTRQKPDWRWESLMVPT